MAKRYCPMCDEWVKGRECPKCGADTDAVQRIGTKLAGVGPTSGLPLSQRSGGIVAPDHSLHVWGERPEAIRDADGLLVKDPINLEDYE